jgi:hypothetical protein
VLIVVNFLCVNNRKCFVVVCFFRIAITITTSRKHVRKDRKICLFVPYAYIISVKLRMVEKGVALNEIWRLGWCKVG